MHAIDPVSLTYDLDDYDPDNGCRYDAEAERWTVCDGRACCCPPPAVPMRLIRARAWIACDKQRNITPERRAQLDRVEAYCQSRGVHRAFRRRDPRCYCSSLSKSVYADASSPAPQCDFCAGVRS